MVFQEIDSITDVISGHRIIIYYIEGKLKYQNENNKTLLKNTETALEMWEKKNDDLLLIKVAHDSEQFKQFEDIYRPEVTGTITLFAVNNEGIPLLSEQINNETNISNAIERLSTACNLNAIHYTKSERTLPPNLKLNSNDFKEVDWFPSSASSSDERIKATLSSMATNSENNRSESHSTSTRLQIRLPNGNRGEEKFANEAMLQEVWIVISTKYNITDFDLKTYNRPIFSEADYEKTLEDLDLCPSGVIIVVSKTVIPFSSSGGIGAMINYGVHRLMTSTRFAFQYIQGLLFVFWNYLFPSDNRSASRRRKEIQSSSDNSDQSSSRSRARKSVSKSIGNNIHTLRRNDDSDEENNRYNGNSTQQK